MTNKAYIQTLGRVELFLRKVDISGFFGGTQKRFGGFGRRSHRLLEGSVG